MKHLTKKVTSAITAAAAMLIIAGCSQAPPPISPYARDIPNGRAMSPERIADNLFAAIKYKDEEGVCRFFSSQVPDKVCEEVQAIIEKKTIGWYHATPVEKRTDSATVKVSYEYSAQKAGGGKGDFVMAKSSMTFSLIPEDGVWKIRTTGIREIDEAANQYLFTKCLNTVLDASIGQEKYRYHNEKYSETVGQLVDQYPPLKDSEKMCKSLRVEKAEIEQYEIIGIANTVPPCFITADQDGFTPQKYSACNASVK